jgi:T5SS/PEP-CTERM-associated repeat protein
MKKKSASQIPSTPPWKNAILLAITALVLSMPAAFGAYTNWTVGTGSWFVDTNWDHNQPDSTTDAFINNGGTALVTDDLANAVALSLTLGQYASDSGTVSVSPPHAGMNVTGTIFVGYRGSGSLIINSPGGVASAGASIASLTTGAVVSNGAATVDGANSTWTVSGEADVGGTTSGAGGTGLLTVTNGGTVSAGTSVHIWNSGTLAGNATVSTTNGTTIDGTIAPNGGGGTLTIGGDLQLHSGATTQCNVTPQNPSTTPQVSVSAQVSLGGHLLVTMAGDSSSAPTRFTLLYADSFNSDHRKFDSQSITYPTGHCWYPVITYDYTGGHVSVYLDRVYNCN